MHDISDDYPELHKECEEFSKKMAKILLEKSNDYPEFVRDVKILLQRMEDWTLRIPKQEKSPCQKQ